MVDGSTTSATASPAAAATTVGVANSTQPVTATVKDAKDAGRRDTSEDADDTMRNLRKTFAGIFGDM